MITVGYGDIMPTSTTEKLVAIVYLLIACAVFSFTITKIGSALQ